MMETTEGGVQWRQVRDQGHGLSPPAIYPGNLHEPVHSSQVGSCTCVISTMVKIYKTWTILLSKGSIIYEDENNW